MSSSTNQITGQEAMWGAEKPFLTAQTLALINSSPLLVSELNDYQVAYNAGKVKAIGVDLNSPTDLQTYNDGFTLQLQFGTSIIEGNSQNSIGDTRFIGDLIYEIRKFENFNSDLALYNQIENLNPNDPDYGAMAAVVGTHAETGSQVNNYVVQQQIFAATSQQAGGPVTILLNGDSNTGGELQSTLDQAYASYKANGVDASEVIPQLTGAVQDITGSVLMGRDPYGNPIDFFDYYDLRPSSVHEFFYGPGSAPTTVQRRGAQALDTADVAFTDNPENGTLQSATIQFSSGTSETLSLSNSQLNSATYTDVSGNVVSTISYVHNSDGSYSATFTDGTGAVTATQNFSSDGSEVETVTNIDTPVDINASGVTLTTNGDVIDVNGQDFVTTILNGDHVINAQAGDTFQLTGVGYDVNLTNAGGSTVTFTAGSGGTVAGTGNTVDVNGEGSNVTTSGNTIAAASGTDATINGGGNLFTANADASGSTFTLEGTGISADTLNLAGATDVTVLLGDTTTAANFVSTDATVTSQNGGGIVTGSVGDNLNILGVNVSLNANGGQYALGGSGDVATVSNSSVSLSGSGTFSLFGVDNSVSAQASGVTATLVGNNNTATATSMSRSKPRCRKSSRGWAIVPLPA